MPPNVVKQKLVKKTTLSDRKYVEQAPAEDDIAVKEAARYLPIDVVERDLDRWAWGTENFTWQIFSDNSRRQWIGASLELVIPWKDDKGAVTLRRIVGACNFQIASYAPNSHFVATAKSECVKNAASDLGKRFGRGLNEVLQSPTGPVAPEVPKGKMKPDKSIVEQFRKAVLAGDVTHQDILLNIYEINLEEQ